MHRWHQENCSRPDIEVLADKTPRCRSCLQSLDVLDIIANQSAASAVPAIPPDKVAGEMNLWWPRSVPYSPMATKSNTSEREDHSLERQTQDLVSKSAPYPSKLRPSEFRLACLSAVDSYDYPLHLTLEIYDLNDCPEYETVSYTWAGEDDDAAPCRLVYVGPFWDVSLQTKNCWEMLRFMRPWRGTRMIWADAVCINQSDIPERNSQVANMGLIYSGCARVVVYLGPDIAIPLRGIHPRRHRLHELEDGAVTPLFPAQQGGSATYVQILPHQLHDLLKRRYFSRIWVVQELLLSQRVVLRVGDVDFWADPVMASYLSASVPKWDWQQTNAAWVQHITQGSSIIKSLGDLLSLTSLSQATDPRDRIFGLLGVMPRLTSSEMTRSSKMNGPSMKHEALNADYSLSCQQLYIGLFAYCLINMQSTSILYQASGLHSNMLNYPSWTPNWTLNKSWKHLFESHTITTQDVLKALEKILRPTCSELALTSPHLATFKAPLAWHVSAKQSWLYGININPSNGALNVNLTHFMPISRPLQRIGSLNGFFIFAMRTETFTVHLLSRHALDTSITESSKDQLFILNVDHGSLMYLILRPVSETHETEYKLVSACPFVLISIPSSLVRENEIPTLQPIELTWPEYALYDAIQDLQHYLDLELLEYDEGKLILSLIPGVKVYRDLVPLFSKIFGEGPPERKDFVEGYLSIVDRKYLPRTESDSFIIITVQSDWEGIQYLNEESTLDNLGFECVYRMQGSHHWCMTTSSAYSDLYGSKEMQLIEIRLEVDGMQRLLTEDLDNTIPILGIIRERVQEIINVRKWTGENILSILGRAPREDDRSISIVYGMAFRDVSYSDLYNELGICGKTSMVTVY